MTFRVWAPWATSVELGLDSSRLPMAKREDGWWEREGAYPSPVDYRFVVDGVALPDPRSQWQPAGVHGPSRYVDHGGFRWSDQTWQTPPLKNCVLYELHVGTFSPQGDFDSVLDRLDHLIALGVDAIELMPVAEFAGRRGWGYDGVDLYAPHHSYGGPAGLKRLVDGCHARGLAVILDVVYNHLGPEGNYLHQYGPYFTDQYSTPWGQPFNLDGPLSQPVRDFLIDNAVMWLRDYHLDGLRLDATHAIIDCSPVHFLEELAGRVRREAGAERWLLAESAANDPRLINPAEQGGFGLDAQWADDFHHALHAVLTGERTGYYLDFGETSQLATALRRAYVYAGEFSRHRQRRQGRPHHSSGERFVICAQNHDQIGNRARGERLGHLVSLGRQKIAAALVVFSPFVPLLFMGEEWGASTRFPFFSSHTDPEIARATSEGRVREFAAFGWRPDQVPDPQSVPVFESARLRWEERAVSPHNELLAWYRDLLALRRRFEVRAESLDQVEVEHGQDWLVLRRPDIAVACNWGLSSQTVEAEGGLLLASHAQTQLRGDVVELQPDTAAILRR